MKDIFQSDMQRIIQESVPGKQITIAHVIASPDPDICERLGTDGCGALGIVTISPFEAAIIAADVATKAAQVEIGFLDRFTGSLTVYGDVQSVETALNSINEVLTSTLGFIGTRVTKT